MMMAVRALRKYFSFSHHGQTGSQMITLGTFLGKPNGDLSLDTICMILMKPDLNLDTPTQTASSPGPRAQLLRSP